MSYMALEKLIQEKKLERIDKLIIVQNGENVEIPLPNFGELEIKFQNGKILYLDMVTKYKFK